LPNGIKKWFMLQMWRIQQVAQIITIVLLSFNLAVLIQPQMEWRGWIFEEKYAAVVFIMLVIFSFVWAFALIWDMRLRMWREQQTVLVERNPYAKEKMAAKEIAIYEMLWLPLLEKMGKDDPKLQQAAADLRSWMDMLHKDDPILTKDLEDIYKFMGKK